ncbi:Methyltransferase type 11 [Candidatus Chlamydia sanziniae]|uniref:Methyltransferase type 11 n=2 Tax=Candidatus Chlamydia sanziniae TaxID=1806891 RepID=A0A1A9HXM9_9CHLA|nr:Methyltransferase type 11 [Candidatus Chlamydia sanziniae]
MKFLLCLCFLSSYLLIFTNEIPIQDDHWDGQHYLNNSDLQCQWAISYIQKFQLSGYEKILDIGCGDGRITAKIAQAVPYGFVFGVDTSDSMLQVAQNLKNKIRLNNLDFIKRDAMNLGFESEFDFIVSFSCFHWVCDHFVALQEIEKALKPGGKVFLYFAPDYGYDRFDFAINTVVASSKWANYFVNFSNPLSLVTPAKFATYVEETGLLLQRLEIITVDETFPTQVAFATWITGWLWYLQQLPKELHQEFLDDIIACYLKYHPIDTDNKLHFIDYWIEVELLKYASNAHH